VSTGQNLPMSPDQLGGVLGNDMVSGLAQQMGMNQGDLLGQLSQMLPQVVDKLTPNGQIPQGDIGGILGSMLGGGQGARTSRWHGGPGGHAGQRIAEAVTAQRPVCCISDFTSASKPVDAGRFSNGSS
jgi:outer membrane lipoprotein SlyB